MASTTFVDNAKVMAKGQVTIPKDVRENDKSIGKHIKLTRNGEVKIENSAVYAMKILQMEMKGEAERAGIKNEQDVVDLVKSVRDEE